ELIGDNIMKLISRLKQPPN
ncbi:unnamed protein product, partial [Allacma fusca]